MWRSLLKKMRVVNADRMKNGTRHEYANSLPSMSPEGGGGGHVVHCTDKWRHIMP